MNFIKRIMLKRLQRKKEEVIKLRWQKAQLEQELQRRKDALAVGTNTEK